MVCRGGAGSRSRVRSLGSAYQRVWLSVDSPDLPIAARPISVVETRGDDTPARRCMDEAALVQQYADMTRGGSGLEKYQIARSGFCYRYRLADPCLRLRRSRQGNPEFGQKGHVGKARAVDTGIGQASKLVLDSAPRIELGIEQAFGELRISQIDGGRGSDRFDFLLRRSCACASGQADQEDADQKLLDDACAALPCHQEQAR